MGAGSSGLESPCARWDTLRKVWLDTDERVISPAGREQIAKCPLRIGIVSTGLMMRDSLEKQHLLGLRFGLVILDEAHKARSRQGFGKDAGSPNELLAFMREIAARSDHVLLGTATPVQTQPEDLWDLIGILHRRLGFAKGCQMGTQLIQQRQKIAFTSARRCLAVAHAGLGVEKVSVHQRGKHHPDPQGKAARCALLVLIADGHAVEVDA